MRVELFFRVWNRSLRPDRLPKKADGAMVHWRGLNYHGSKYRRIGEGGACLGFWSCFDMKNEKCKNEIFTRFFEKYISKN